MSLLVNCGVYAEELEEFLRMLKLLNQASGTIN